METRTAQANFKRLLAHALKSSRSTTHPRDLVWPDIYPSVSDDKCIKGSKHRRTCEDPRTGLWREGQDLASHKQRPRRTQSPEAQSPGLQPTDIYHGVCDTETNVGPDTLKATSPDTYSTITALSAGTFSLSAAIISRLQASAAARRIQVRLAVPHVLAQAVAVNSAQVLHIRQTIDDSISFLETRGTYNVKQASLRLCAHSTCRSRASG